MLPSVKNTQTISSILWVWKSNSNPALEGNVEGGCAWVVKHALIFFLVFTPFWGDRVSGSCDSGQLKAFGVFYTGQCPDV